MADGQTGTNNTRFASQSSRRQITKAIEETERQS